MTVLDSFLAFAKRLPANRLAPVEAVLAALMDTHDEKGAFTAGELAELDQRLAEPAPRFADQSAINDLLGRTRRA